ncbi:MAG: hypothetical protein JNL67_20955 [Planctomycetaceae bacterium]|nr:hypothetical protein [Planctomycetaceae bacterium]
MKHAKRDFQNVITMLRTPASIGCLMFFLSATSVSGQGLEKAAPATTQERTDLFISGIYPHLTTYGVYSENGAHTKKRHEECGIGAVVPWAGKLWMVNYAPHMPNGSEHKLFSIDSDLSKPMTVHPESVGGTPAGRMIHAESRQLLIGHHLIDPHGKVRTIQPSVMPMRVTAIARHLKDPANKVYYIDMEGAIWEADVYSLEVTRLYKKPVPGWHAKGGYTSQGRLVISNNGELPVGDYQDLLVGGKSQAPDERGVLAEWDGTEWRIVERRQYTDVTGPNGIAGGGDADDLLWAIGWDRRSLRLKVLDAGQWHTYLLPKAAFCNDASHGWYTEWPRIRSISNDRWMLDMHGMFFDFPKTFSSSNTAGIKPIGSHLRYIPDFCEWNGRLVLASDDTSIQQNPMAGQPQSNLWFGSPDDLKNWGPATAYGGPWIEDNVKANELSDPFLVAGFDQRVLHLKVTDSQGPVVFQIQIDVHGTGVWTDFHKLTVHPDHGTSYIFSADFAATWLRLKTDQPCRATACLHQTTKRFQDGSSAENKELFAGLADVEAKNVFSTLHFPAKHNRNLQVITGGSQFTEFTKSKFEFERAEANEDLKKLLEVKPVFAVDAASAIIKHGDKTLRLPKGHPRFNQPFEYGWPRGLREVISERELANILGTFYEIPLVNNGQPPAWNLMRPISSHQKQITDFSTWNGLLVLGGVRADAKNDGHVFVDSISKTGLWFGGIDDLWKLGKPVGDGGPWFETSVEANIPSDPYLMTGYDKKLVKLSHSSTHPVTIRLEVDVTGTGVWIPYQSFEVPGGEPMQHEFPAGFSANWIRAVSNQETKATVQFEYR